MSTLSPPRLAPSRAPVAPLLLGGAVVGGLAAGAGTSLLQGVLPGDWNVLANSGAVWTLLAFLLALPAARVTGLAVAAGTLALLAEVAGYYAIALPLRDIASSPAERVLWSCAALVVGPLAGLAARHVHFGTPTGRTVALLALCGVAAGEALHGLVRIPGHTSASTVELAVALMTAAVSVMVVRAPWGGRVLGVVVGMASAGCVALVYGAPVLV